MGRKNIESCSFKIQGDTPARSFKVNSDDIVQWRYEMIRESALSREPIDSICKKYRYSRDMYYYYKGKFDAQGMLGLNDDKPGPRAATKRTEDVDRLIIELRFKNPNINMYEIANHLNQMGVDISARSVSRTLEDHSLALKKTKGMHQKKTFSMPASSTENPEKKNVK